MTNTVSYTTALRNQKAVTAYLKSEQLLPFGFAQQNCPSSCDKKYRYKECHLQWIIMTLIQNISLRPLESERVYLRIYKVADTPIHI